MMTQLDIVAKYIEQFEVLHEKKKLNFLDNQGGITVKVTRGRLVTKNGIEGGKMICAFLPMSSKSTRITREVKKKLHS